MHGEHYAPRHGAAQAFRRPGGAASPTPTAPDYRGQDSVEVVVLDSPRFFANNRECWMTGHGRLVLRYSEALYRRSGLHG